MQPPPFYPWMEQQFILRLPEQLQNADLSNAQLEFLSERDVRLHIDDDVFPGAVCRLPTIVESHRCSDNKLFKVADIGTLVLICPPGADVAAEAERAEQHGLTPPMAHALARRMRASAARTELFSQTEQEVQRLLQEDAKAVSVEIITGDEPEDEIDQLAAAIENDVIGDYNSAGSSVPRPAQSKSISEGADAPRTASQGGAFEAAQPNGNNLAEMGGKEDVSAQPVAVRAENSEELKELNARISERQSLLEKAVNPILKKRFSQMLAELEEERRQLLERLNRK